MKAKVKTTGEIVEVTPCREPISTRLAFYETEQGRKFPMFALEFEKEIDWEQRRYEIAKEMMPIASTQKVLNQAGAILTISRKGAAKWAVEYADDLIAELKKGGSNETD